MDLPAEILQYVALYLHDTHRPSLVSFSSVSKKCHAAATVWLFRSIQLRIIPTNPAQLRREAFKWTRILQRTESQHHVRQVAIISPHRVYGQYTLPSDQAHARAHHIEALSRLDEKGLFGSVGEEEDKTWLPVASLVGLTSRLNDLVYKLKHTLPPCLLRVLHEQHPQCRLHIDWFRFNSLHEPTIDPHELAIATSPCLHSITVRYDDHDYSGRAEWNSEAQLRLVAGMAPNLKSVRSEATRTNISQSLDTSWSPWGWDHAEGNPWPGFSHLDEDLPSPGSLESLSLLCLRRVRPVGIHQWMRATDSSCLRKLDLQEVSHEMLHWAAENVSFPNLKDLRLKLDRDMHASNNCVKFLSAIPPLENLDYWGVHDKVFDCILDRHGPSLLKLTLSEYVSNLDLTAVRKLQSKCPRVESLDIAIERSAADETEISVYRALGNMRCLTDLSLRMWYSYRPAPSPRIGVRTRPDPQGLAIMPYEEFDDPFDQTIFPGCEEDVRYGHVRFAFLNSAIDDTLALSIWDTIEDSKEDGAKPLQSLNLLPIEWWHSSGIPPGFSEFFNCMSRSYSLERSVRDDEDGVTVREIAKEVREAKCNKLQMPEKDENDPKRQSMAAVFRHMWPKKDGSASWQDDWSSMPLRK